MTGQYVYIRGRVFLFAVCVVIPFVIASGDFTPELHISEEEIWENSNVTLTCICPKDTIHSLSTWKFANNTFSSSFIMKLENKICNIFGVIEQFSVKYKCVDNTTFRLTLTNVRRQQSGYRWICTCGILNENDLSNPIVIVVNVPVINTILQVDSHNISKNTTIKILNNTKIYLKCLSTCARPEAKITWYIPGYNNNSSINLSNTTSGLICLQSTAYYTPTLERRDHQVYCSASNKGKEQVYSSTITMDVLHPPRVGNLPNTSTIEGKNFEITCSGVQGNPNITNYRWSNENNVTFLEGKNLVIRHVSRTNETFYTCTMKNKMNPTFGLPVDGKSSARFYLTVLYKPIITSIMYRTHFTTQVLEFGQTVYILEGESFNISCFANSKPDPRTSWIGPVTAHSHDLVVHGIKRNKNGTYICSSTNNMPFNNTIVIGNSQANVAIDVLYPAIVNDIHDISIVEGSHLETLCPVVDGNPSNSRVTWSRLSDENRWTNALLFIKNVSRADDAEYTCSVITEMHPTIGSALLIERRKSCHLNVFFPSEIHTFTISTVSSGRTFAVNETQNPSFECIAKANPISDLKIQSPRGFYIIEVSKSNFARHTLRNASFKDAGEYICIGRNIYTRDLPSQSKLLLIVKSRPRPSSGDTNAKKVATILNVDVTLPFQARKYLDEPNKTMFSWFKENVSISDNDNKYLIHSNDLQTTITIRNTAQQDLGFYKVKVENSVGIYTHYYELKVTDKPERPRDFRLRNDSITDSSVTLAWRPGFNGGFQQTFIIIYRLIHEHLWLNKSINDNGDTDMNYTLNDLSSMQKYEIEMLAKNKKGNSLHTERLHFKTKASIYKLKETKTTHSSNTGLLVGVGVGASVTTLAFVAVAFIGYKRFKNMRRPSHNDSPKSVHVSSTYTDLDTSRRERNDYDGFKVPSTTPYEQLNTSTREKTTYMELKCTNVPNTDTSDYVNIRI